jgi:hypothetical protein
MINEEKEEHRSDEMDDCIGKMVARNIEPSEIVIEG